MNKPNKGDVLVGNYGRRVVVAPITEKDGKKYVTFFTGYATITEEIEVFIKGYTKDSYE